VLQARGERASSTADDAASEMSWRSSSNNADDSLKKHMLKISCKLNDETFKDGVIKALREYFYDRDFLDKLDANPNLLAFSNGVWELKEKKFRQARAEDFVSMNTGYDYCDDPDPEADAKIQQYWEMLHPDPGQREYIQKTFARQLYGDSGNELFHIHTGRNATASNGKTKLVELSRASRCRSSRLGEGSASCTARSPTRTRQSTPES
jgi:phage/plasmid-associated DNA primase